MCWFTPSMAMPMVMAGKPRICGGHANTASIGRRQAKLPDAARPGIFAMPGSNPRTACRIDHLSGRPAGIVRGKECDDVRNIVGATDT